MPGNLTVWMCEKPDAGKKIAGFLSEVLGIPTSRGQGCINVGAEHVVTWTIGHIIELRKQAKDYDPKWGSWSIEQLPIVPSKFLLDPVHDGRETQIPVVVGLVKKATSIVVAGDAGREGQRIQDEMIVYAGRDPFAPNVKRLWLSSLVLSDFKRAYADMKPNAAYKSLSVAADCRAQADWLHGVSASRLFSILSRNAGGDIAKIGRVKSTVVALVVDRDREIANFRPTDHYGVEVTFELDGGRDSFKGSWIIPPDLDCLDSEGRLLDKNVALSICRKVEGHMGKVREASSVDRRESSPLPFALSDLQIHMNNLCGMTLGRTSDIAQKLYDNGLTSYPRSDCTFLPTSIHAEAADKLKLLGSLSPTYQGFVDRTDPRLRHSAINDARVSDHHAVIPVFTSADQITGLAADEKQVLDAIIRRYIALYMPDHKFRSLSAVVLVEKEPFKATGKVEIDQGWRAVVEKSKASSEDDDDDQNEGENPSSNLKKKPSEEENSQSLPDLKIGDEALASKALLSSRSTRPPAFYTDATLVEAMKNASKYVSESQYKSILKSTHGIGTEATRDTIVKNAFDDGLLIRSGKKIKSTLKGKEVTDAVRAVDGRYNSPAFSAIWESKLALVVEDRLSGPAFMKDVVSDLTQLIEAGKAKGNDPKLKIGTGTEPLEGDGKPCPECGVGTMRTRVAQKTGKRFLACDNWRKDDPNSCKHVEWSNADDEKGKTGSSRAGGFGASSARRRGGSSHSSTTRVSSGGSSSHPREGAECPKCHKGHLKLRTKKDNSGSFLSCDSWRPGATDNCGYIENTDGKPSGSSRTPSSSAGGHQRNSVSKPSPAPKKPDVSAVGKMSLDEFMATKRARMTGSSSGVASRRPPPNGK